MLDFLIGGGDSYFYLILFANLFPVELTPWLYAYGCFQNQNSHAILNHLILVKTIIIVLFLRGFSFSCLLELQLVVTGFDVFFLDCYYISLFGFDTYLSQFIGYYWHVTEFIVLIISFWELF